MNYQDTVRTMAGNLFEHAKLNDVNLTPIKVNPKFDVNDLDDLFNDGGQFRCEDLFGQLAAEYAIQHHEFDSTEFYNKQYAVMAAAIRRVSVNLRDIGSKKGCAKN